VNPVKTETANYVYVGPTVDIGDVWVTRSEHQIGDRIYPVVYLDFVASPEEAADITAGAPVRIGIIGREPIPAINVAVHRGLQVVSDEPPVREEPAV
jgi:hypothetical protein